MLARDARMMRMILASQRSAVTRRVTVAASRHAVVVMPLPRHGRYTYHDIAAATPPLQSSATLY